jgi:ribosome-binding factor A
MKHRSQNTPHGGGERSQRQLRVGEVIRHALVEALARGDLRDPVLQDVSITVTEVHVSPDLRNATAFVMPLGGEHGDEVVKALRRASGYLRRLVGQEKLTMKFLPHLSFELDTAFDHGARMDALLREVASDLHDEDDAADEPSDRDDGA